MIDYGKAISIFIMLRLICGTALFWVGTWLALEKDGRRYEFLSLVLMLLGGFILAAQWNDDHREKKDKIISEWHDSSAS